MDYVVLGLLDVLYKVLLTLKDADLPKVFDLILKPEVLVVLCNHSAAAVKIAVLQVSLITITEM